jgi:transposase
VRGVANRYTGAAQGFAQRDFTIDWERERVTCPRGKASVTWRAGLDEGGDRVRISGPADPAVVAAALRALAGR